MPAVDGMPVACTLSAAEMGPRLARIHKLTDEHLRAHRVDGSTLRLTYAAAAAAELVEIVELERDCCAFLAFELTTSADSVELHISAPAGSDADSRWLFAQFLAEKAGPNRSIACSCQG